MKVLHITVLFITIIPLLLLTAVIVPFALIGMLANITMMKVANLVNDFSREIENITRSMH